MSFYSNSSHTPHLCFCVNFMKGLHCTAHHETPVMLNIFSIPPQQLGYLSWAPFWQQTFLSGDSLVEASPPSYLPDGSSVCSPVE